jgi:O-antigen/teichoic acid export membrane protein
MDNTYYQTFKIAIKSIANKSEFDRSVFYSISTKLWTIISGPLSIFLVVSFFTKVQQGYYYTFASILALQIFVEMGIGSVIQQFSSHEWAHLQFDKDGNIIGNKESLSRLVSIAKISFKWFFFGGVIAIIGLSIGGYVFFYTSVKSTDGWMFPWIMLSILTGLNFMLTPIWSLLEGCNQVRKLYGFRFFQGILINIMVWISIILGANLWATVVASLIGLICSIIFIRARYKSFFITLFFTSPDGPKICWKSDMFKMQWKVAISWISGYFSFFLFTPILFRYQGAEAAGQFGMTWAIISIIGGVGNAWLTPKVPQFAIFVSQKNYEALDRQFWKIVKIILMVTCFMAFCFWGAVFIMNIYKTTFTVKFSSRLLSPMSIAFLLIAQILQVVSIPFSSYMRAHKKEPVMFLSVMQGVCIASCTWYFGKYYAVLDIAISYLVINFVSLPMIINLWYRFREKEIASLALNTR